MTEIVLPSVVIAGGFDGLELDDVRFLEESAKLGELTVLLWTDNVIEQITGKRPKLPLADRHHILNSLCHVKRVIQLGGRAMPDSLPAIVGFRPQIWADKRATANAVREQYCRNRNVAYHVFSGMS